MVNLTTKYVFWNEVQMYLDNRLKQEKEKGWFVVILETTAYIYVELLVTMVISAFSCVCRKPKVVIFI